ncbi:MAG TPA: cupin domain-containing protein [Caulobacteraceae bacterium]|nr:cupin domain-containing protein [Caulobacteraceae bacterium]
MQKFDGARFEAEGAWRGPNIALMEKAVVVLRWTDQPFVWHANVGEEVFVVLDGVVDMHVRSAATPEQVVTLRAGDVLHIRHGEEHVAHPRGPARVLVVEELEAAAQPPDAALNTASWAAKARW